MTGPIHELLYLMLVLLVVAAILTVVAARLRIPYAVLLVVGGGIIGFIPNLPYVRLLPDVILLIFLPPLIYYAAWFTSWRNFRKEWRAITSLAIGLVLVTVVSVAAIAHAFVPGLPWASAFVLGAVVSPTDAVAAESIIQSLGLNRRIATIISGESLVNDATALVAYRLAIAAVSVGSFSVVDAGVQFLLVSIGGTMVGLGIAVLAVWLHRWANNTLSQIALSLITPFTMYLSAEGLKVSGVIAVVAGGMYLGRHSANFFTSNTRLQSDAFWHVFVFLLNVLIFLLIGVQLGHLNLGELSLFVLIGYAALVSLTVVVVRFIWGFLFGSILRILDKIHVLQYQQMLPWPALLVIGWSGMRGGISMATALAIPTLTASGIPFPGRDTIVLIAFGVIFFTLLFQGVTLGPLIRWLNLHDDPAGQEERHLALQAVTQAALARLEELKLDGEAPESAIERLHTYYEKRLNALIEDEGDELGSQRTRLASLQQLTHDIHMFERRALIDLRDSGTIDDNVFHQIERELDLEDVRLRRL
ncbi:Na+/H+ antiporter [Ktedonospora formicarum]|uniref:Na+/H+ antiporter n=1 Tax=Ktedonospora formicarum TaxID=2778364 RepID=A0A8J3I644_9CHLR|nr:Na+/H+ antiporter [Ktedonospora formicarum]GHO46578.1 Na+/H+ antiporter [Ktedonospora formicarum]